jgi:hypothetical protein
MGVETISFERFSCERCDAIEDIRCGDLDQRNKWGHASAQHYQGDQLFSRDYKITLCPACCTSLRQWSVTSRAA